MYSMQRQFCIQAHHDLLVCDNDTARMTLLIHQLCSKSCQEHKAVQPREPSQEQNPPHLHAEPRGFFAIRAVCEALQLELVKASSLMGAPAAPAPSQHLPSAGTPQQGCLWVMQCPQVATGTPRVGDTATNTPTMCPMQFFIGFLREAAAPHQIHNLETNTPVLPRTVQRISAMANKRCPRTVTRVIF